MLSLVISILSCSAPENEGGVHQDIRRADMILENGTFTLYQERESPIEFSARTVSFYEADSTAELDDMSFRQISEDGSTSIEGSADHGQLDTENEIMVLSGSVQLISNRDSMQIIADGHITFNTRTQEVEAEGKVSVQKEDISFNSSHFYGNLLSESYSFTALEEGRIII